MDVSKIHQELLAAGVPVKAVKLLGQRPSIEFNTPLDQQQTAKARAVLKKTAITAPRETARIADDVQALAPTIIRELIEMVVVPWLEKNPKTAAILGIKVIDDTTLDQLFFPQ